MRQGDEDTQPLPGDELENQASPESVPVPPNSHAHALPTWFPAFLATYAGSGNLSRAAKHAGTSRPTVYKLLRDEPWIVGTLQEIRDELADNLEGALYERALRSDTAAAIFLLKAMRPSQYRDNWRQSADQGQHVQVTIDDVARGRPALEQPSEGEADAGA